VDGRSIWMGRSEPRDANGLAGIVAERWLPVGREPLIATVPSVLCPNEGSPPLLFRNRAASTLLAIEIEMVAGLRLPARGRMASLLGEAEGADAVSRRLKRAVLAGQPDVNQSSPSSIGPAASSGGRAAMACDPVAPVAFPRDGVDGRFIWMGRSEPRDANGLAAASRLVMVARGPRAIDRYR